MPRKLDLKLPRCRVHPDARITKSGKYRRDKDTLVLRCWPTRTADAHAFSVRAPGYLPRFRYSTSDIAQAMLRLGEGYTYAAAAYEARERAGRKQSVDMNLVVSWLDRFGKRIADALAPEQEPGGTLLLDQLLFNVSALDASGKPKPAGRLAFAVMGAAISRGAGRPQIVRLFAAPNKTELWWRQFLELCDVRPDRILCDEDDAMINAIKARWPKAERVLCHWHLENQAEQILIKYKRHSRRDPLYRSLQSALNTRQAWGRFRSLAERSGIADLDGWVTMKDDLVRAQLRRKVAPMTTGALETLLRDVKKMLIARRASFEDFDRMDLVLGLAALHLNGKDRAARFREVIEGDASASGYGSHCSLPFSASRHLSHMASPRHVPLNGAVCKHV